jgi:dihydroxyacetone synthase
MKQIGHTCLWQYAFMHLVGYSNMTMDELKGYHSNRTDCICAGHPEIEVDGIEVTTGPLGQGVANAVGLAMATKQLGATYNTSEHEVVDNTTWCMIGDACLQEGVALEAISLAGHWRLNNLVIIYDNNNITCDGTVDICNTEDVNAKMRACGWNVLEVEDGNFDVEGIVKALLTAKASQDKPTFINIHTIIGIGSAVAGDADAHGKALGAKDVANVKRKFGMNPNEHFIVPEKVYDFFRDVKTQGRKWESEWNSLVADYTISNPALAAEFDLRVEGKFTADWRALIPKNEDLPTAATSSRKSSGIVSTPLAANLTNLLVGTADLTPSVNLSWPSHVPFQHPSLRPLSGQSGSYQGRYIHYGIREHAMCAIANGLAAFRRGSFIPITSTFFMFYLYAAPGVRMGALMSLQGIHVATHDSIGMGEDGPTHQPVELAALYRAMPKLLYLRPCDGEEVAGCWIAALEHAQGPSMLSLSRQALVQYPQYSSREGVQKGAYVFVEEEGADVTLIGVGAEMEIVVNTRRLLKEMFDLKARIVSFPCQRLFEAQSLAYRREVLRYREGIPVVVIEPYAVNGWERYADAGVSMKSFGHSLPGKVAYEYFGFTAEKIAPRVKELVDEVRREGIDCVRGEFRDLTVRMNGH